MGTWSRDRPSLDGMVQNFKGGDKHDVISWSFDLAKLNPIRLDEILNEELFKICIHRNSNMEL